MTDHSLALLMEAGVSLESKQARGKVTSKQGQPQVPQASESELAGS